MSKNLAQFIPIEPGLLWAAVHLERLAAEGE